MSSPPKLSSVERAFVVLDTVGRLGQPASLSEIAEAAAIDKSAAQRMTNTLLALGYLERSGPRSGLVLGRRALYHAYDYLFSTPLVERATSLLLELRRTARERVDLSLFDDTMIVYAVRLQSKRENFPATLVGRRMPSFASTGGRAMMSLMSEAERMDILDRSDLTPLTHKTICDRNAILKEIRKAEELGHSLAVEESLVGEVVLAAPISDETRRPLGAVHIAGSLSEWDVADFQKKFSPLAMEAAQTLSRR